jgi:Protein of unknown function (DUF4238)
MVESDSRDVVAGPAISEVGSVGAMRLLVSQHQVGSPSTADRLALARFAGLMYRRAPALEELSVTFGAVYQGAAQTVLDRRMPGIRPDFDQSVDSRRWRMIANAETIADRLVLSNWWIARSVPDRGFVVSDQPVGTTLTLGHVDEAWRAIFAPDTYVITLPLNPGLALLIAPQVMIPIVGIETVDQVAPAVNLLTWRSANRYLLARNRHDLETAVDDDELRRKSTHVSFDWDFIANRAASDAARIIDEVQGRPPVIDWPAWWWDGSRLRFEMLGYNGEDAEYIRGLSVGAHKPSRRRPGPS